MLTLLPRPTQDWDAQFHSKLWNPYIMAKPSGNLVGHSACIQSILVNEEDSHIISISEDMVGKARVLCIFLPPPPHGT